MKKLFFLLLLLVCATHTPAALNVRDFGAKGDGITLDTPALQAAIDSAAALGGETVLLPAGRYLSGTLVLKSHVALCLNRGAVLLGSPRLEDYPPHEAQYVSHVNRYCNRSLLFAEGAEDIALYGEGTIDGQGSLENYPATETETLMGITRRPYLIRMISCKGIRLAGLHLRCSPAWTQHYLDCEDLFVDGIEVYNHGNYNNDGIDVDNCRQVRIVNCLFDTDDDAICFKSTNATGRCENVVVANCVIAANCNAMKWGSETNGGFRNFTVANCTFRRSDEATIYDRPHRALGGLAIESVDGAILENFNLTNISMNGVMTPLFIRLANRGRNYYDGGPSQPVGRVRNIHISNLTAEMYGCITSSITGITGHPVENITLTDVHIICEGGGEAAYAANRDLPDREKEYPETLLFADAPASGLYIKEAEGVRLRNVTLECRQADPRALLFLDKVSDTRVDDVRLNNPSGEPQLLQQNCSAVEITPLQEPAQPVKADKKTRK
ncbi:MAG: glycoside hydrolase family 28 protein [Porphyromonadaceae bacterium]|nr:glycoside hydrolase family 28 protein [Porphyromonadaceae bacterium]